MDVYKHAINIGAIAGILILIVIFSGVLLPMSIRKAMDLLYMLVPTLVAMAIGILAVKNARDVLPGLIDAMIISGLSGVVAGLILGIAFIIVDIVFSNQTDILLSLLVGLVIIIIYTIPMGIIAAICGTLYSIVVFRITKLYSIR